MYGDGPVIAVIDAAAIQFAYLQGGAHAMAPPVAADLSDRSSVELIFLSIAVAPIVKTDSTA